MSRPGVDALMDILYNVSAVGEVSWHDKQEVAALVAQAYERGRADGVAQRQAAIVAGLRQIRDSL